MDGKVRSPRKELGNLGPLVAMLLVGVNQDPVLLGAPGIPLDVWIKHIEPSLPACSASPCATQTSSTLIPLFWAMNSNMLADLCTKIENEKSCQLE